MGTEREMSKFARHSTLSVVPVYKSYTYIIRDNLANYFPGDLRLTSDGNRLLASRSRRKPEQKRRRD